MRSVENMNETTVGLLNEVSQTAEMGKNTVRRLLDVTDDEKMLAHLHSEMETFEDVSRRAHAMLATAGQLPKEQSPVAKLSAQLGIGMKTMIDRSPRSLAEMLIEGNTMGVTQMAEALRDAPGANAGAVALARRLQSAEETYAQELHEFL